MKTAQPRPGQTRSWRRAVGPILLALGLAAASYPVWRVALLGSKPTLEELMRVTCSATEPAGPPQRIKQRIPDRPPATHQSTLTATTSPSAASRTGARVER